MPRSIDVDRVLRVQGTNPDVLRRRGSRAVKVAEQAVRAGRALVQPAVARRRLAVAVVSSCGVVLADGSELAGPLPARWFAGAAAVEAVVCSIGHRLDEAVTSLATDEPAYALALDVYGALAIDTLLTSVCRAVDDEAAADGLASSSPISPGDEGWCLEDGQRQVFAVLGSRPAGVALTDRYFMTPRMSTSFVIGLGSSTVRRGRPCATCGMRMRCRYRERYG